MNILTIRPADRTGNYRWLEVAPFEQRGPGSGHPCQLIRGVSRLCNTTVLAGGLKDPTDLVYAIDGSMYFTDPPAGIVYQITRKGDLLPASRDCEHPFGVALAPNQQRLFVTDRARRQIRVYDVAGNGSLGAGKLFTACDGEPGGLKTDEAGGVWLACSAGISHFDSAGRQLQTIALPEPSGNCNWGEGFRNLYVTAGTSVYRVRGAVNGTRTY